MLVDTFLHINKAYDEGDMAAAEEGQRKMDAWWGQQASRLWQRCCMLALLRSSACTSDGARVKCCAVMQGGLQGQAGGAGSASGQSSPLWGDTGLFSSSEATTRGSHKRAAAILDRICQERLCITAGSACIASTGT